MNGVVAVVVECNLGEDVTYSFCFNRTATIGVLLFTKNALCGLSMLGTCTVFF